MYLHGVAGEAGRERFGDAGLIASDLPEGLAIARKRLLASTERRAPGRRLGFTARESPAPMTPEPDVGPEEPAVGEPLDEEAAVGEPMPDEFTPAESTPVEAPAEGSPADASPTDAAPTDGALRAVLEPGAG